MKLRGMAIGFAAAAGLAALGGCARAAGTKDGGAMASGEYPNHFQTVLGKSEAETRAKVEAAWQKLFYGGDASERVYYPVGADMAYVMDIGNKDIRSEGMSYGMMIAVQLDKKEEFDRLWKWAATYMRQSSGVYEGYFAWHCRPDGSKIDQNPASDGEEYFATALFFASGRWGNGEGIFNYRKEAQSILDAMLHATDHGGVNTFDAKEKQVVFVAQAGGVSTITDPSYHLPHFYQLWSEWADKDNAFWKEAVAASRAFLKKAAHPKTGLTSDYAEFDGRPIDMFSGKHDTFAFDAWRVGMNVAMDYAWFKADPWEAKQSDRLLSFFKNQGLGSYGNRFTLDGKPLGTDHSLGLIAMNAVAATASTLKDREAFILPVWNASPPSGTWRYYDGLLYMLSLLHLSGNYRIYAPK